MPKKLTGSLLCQDSTLFSHWPTRIEASSRFRSPFFAAVALHSDDRSTFHASPCHIASCSTVNVVETGRGTSTGQHSAVPLPAFLFARGTHQFGDGDERDGNRNIYGCSTGNPWNSTVWKTIHLEYFWRRNSLPSGFSQFALHSWIEFCGSGFWGLRDIWDSCTSIYNFLRFF